MGMVSDACQIKDLDHRRGIAIIDIGVSDACQIKDLDHFGRRLQVLNKVSDACQIKDLDHQPIPYEKFRQFQMPVRSKT